MRFFNPFQVLLSWRLIFCVVLSVICVACSTAPTKSSTSNETVNTEAWPAWSREVLLNALSLKGTKYKYGGSSPETGFDCSGFVQYVFKQSVNLALPRNTFAQSQLGTAIAKQDLQAGDLVFFNTVKNTISHVGIYMGDNRFIHAPNTRGQVRIEPMVGYWAQRYSGAQRLENEVNLAQQNASNLP
ncbi:MAG TPA: C40 family peptidase [Methylotenera sp.]|nr:C40 family peptidase [Methylotenera sp.]HPH06298.1 C40 family peptidase [Methylotenera sp.]HPN00356.1 C40 family peptidase [Methylotenera sp.]